MATTGIVPHTKPQMSKEELLSFIRESGSSIDTQKHPLWIIGIRGYYLNTMGEAGKDDRGIYDDALFIYSEPVFRSFNANTNPANYANASFRREGSGFGGNKGFATLNTGLWIVYKFDNHVPQSGGEPYLALCQRGRPVKVTRDGYNGNDYPDEGQFGINIHRGGYTKVSSVGCQTIHPDQWDGSSGFITVAKTLAVDFFEDQWRHTYIPYLLIDMPNTNR